MTRKLEETFNLPPLDLSEDLEDEIEDINQYSPEEINALMERADKIDAALPQVSGLDRIDADYDDYAEKAIDAFTDLFELSKNVEDRHAADIATAASNMLANALNAKTNKAQKKIEMVKLQIQKAKLEHEQEKLEYLKKRHLKEKSDDVEETEGRIISTRNDILNDILAGIKRGDE